MRHGPHQGAQKSTSTGCCDCSTSASKLSSVNSTVLAPMTLTPWRKPFNRLQIRFEKHGIIESLGRASTQSVAHPNRLYPSSMPRPRAEIQMTPDSFSCYLVTKDTAGVRGEVTR